MNIWNVLGIDATNNIGAIKKAYATKLKIYHPEENPQGFQELREAYEQALQQAATRKQQSITAVPSTQLDDNDSQAISHQHIELFMSRLEKLYHEPALRTNIEQWKELLEDEILWNLAAKQQLNYSVLAFLMQHDELPRDAWILLNKVFFWTEQIEDLYNDFPADFINFIIREINGTNNFEAKFRNRGYGMIVMGLGAACWLAIIYLLLHKDSELVTIVGGIALGCLFFCVGYFGFCERRIAISNKNQEIVIQNAYKTIKYRFAEVQGFEIERTYMTILGCQLAAIPNSTIKLYVTVDGKSKSHRLAGVSYSEELIQVLSEYFNEWNSAIELQQEAILSGNKAHFYRRYNQAVNFEKGLSVISVLVAGWLIFDPRPYIVAISVNITLPMVGVLLFFIYKDVASFDNKNDRPNFLEGAIFPASALVYTAIFEYSILLTQSFLFYLTGIIIAGLVGLSFVWHIRVGWNKKYRASFLAMMVFISCYFGALAVHINCVGDNSTTNKSQAVITKKEYNAKPFGLYYIYAKPSPDFVNNEIKLAVQYKLYEKARPGDSIYFYFKDGLLGLKWAIHTDTK